MPYDLWGKARVGKLYPEKWAEVARRFPLDFARAPGVLGPSERASGVTYMPGLRTDEWGSVWRAMQRGVAGEVTRPVLDDWAKLAAFRAPDEMIENPNLDAVANFCASTDRFRLGEIGSGPFERLQFLRGVGNLYLDLGEQPAELADLIHLVHEFHLRHIDLWCRTDVDGITMGDDWGSQTSPLIAPEMWRGMFRNLYGEYFDRIHQAGKYVFLHSDGMIRPIMPDLIEIGVDAINAQIFCMDIEELGRSFRGKVTFWGTIDEQFARPYATTEDVRAAVRRVCRALGGREGGLIAQLAWTWTTGDQTENIVAAFEEWSEVWNQ